jgi:hypothetical protein
VHVLVEDLKGVAEVAIVLAESFAVIAEDDPQRPALQPANA